LPRWISTVAGMASSTALMAASKLTGTGVASSVAVGKRSTIVRLRPQLSQNMPGPGGWAQNGHTRVSGSIRRIVARTERDTLPTSFHEERKCGEEAHQ
jgi:hypothetical protein